MSDSVAKPRSDLGIRTLSAFLMIAIAGGALWAGGILWDIFVAVVVVATFVEFAALIRKTNANTFVKAAAFAAGALYISLAAYFLMEAEPGRILVIIATVVAVDTLAYFFGRTLGGPKIAPKISPSKTWAGLLGGVVGASLVICLVMLGWHSGICEFYYGIPADLNQRPPYVFEDRCHTVQPILTHIILISLLSGTAIAVAAQTGDFFESWLKRKASVKDSSNLIPGHGGVFDRVDGMIPVILLFGFFA